MVNKVIKKGKDGYKEANCELAKENGQLRQQLSQFQYDNAQQSEQILDLKTQVIDLLAIKNKYDTIVKIVLDIGDDLNSTGEAQELSSTASSSSNRPSSSNTTSERSSHDKNLTREIARGEEHEDEQEKEHEDEQDDEPIQFEEQDRGEEERSRKQIELNRISEKTEERDSLMPCECTSVPPFRIEVVDVTPSVWKVLDDVEIEKSHHHDNSNMLGNSRSVVPLQPQQNPNSTSPDGQRISNDALNAASPIQPIGPQRTIGINSVFHSTPVRNRNGNPKEIQENLQRQSKDFDKRVPESVEKQLPKTKGRAKKRPQAQSETQNTTEDGAPSRYNLRKRAKQQVA